MIPLSIIYWDPNPEIFFIPGLNWPILWYGVLFAAGFAIGFPIFVGILTRFFLNRPEYHPSDVLKADKRQTAETLNERISRGLVSKKNREDEKLVLTSGCIHPEKALVRLSLDRELGKAVLGLKRKAVVLTDRLTIYMIVATVVGARLGHFFFYEHPMDYLTHPSELFRVWEGGLASHGAVIGIILAMFLFSHRIRTQAKELNWIRLLDFVSVPTALAGAFIRIGNFFNQEILGTPSELPWAVVFGHPADHSMPIPRHPVQIYEALFYFAVFFLLWRLTFRPSFLLTRGKLIGLFLILVFGFRFLVEYLKTEQSHIVSMSSVWTMGQYLSLPVIAAGFLFYFWNRWKRT